MKKKAVNGVSKLTNGKGPFVGEIKIGRRSFMLIVGKNPTYRSERRLPNFVCMSRVSPNLIWTLDFQSAEVAETTGRVLEAMEQVSVKQIEALGFVEDRREDLGN